jgi:hypothetical protein
VAIQLYDLMTMGCKYQILSCSHPADLLQASAAVPILLFLLVDLDSSVCWQISLNHLDALRKLLKTSDVSRLVEACTKQFVEVRANHAGNEPQADSSLRPAFCSCSRI